MAERSQFAIPEDHTSKDLCVLAQSLSIRVESALLSLKLCTFCTSIVFV